MTPRSTPKKSILMPNSPETKNEILEPVIQAPKKSIVMQQEGTTNEGEANLQDQVAFLTRELMAMKADKEKKPSLQSQKEIYSGPNSYSFRMIDGKIITHFEMTKDITKNNLNGIGTYEVQTCKVTYSDGTTEDMVYADYSNAVVWSPKYTLYKLERRYKIYLQGSVKPLVLSYHEAIEKYTKIVKDQQNRVWNFDILGKDPIVDDLHTFHITDMNEDDKFIYNDGEPFTVDSTAIN